MCVSVCVYVCTMGACNAGVHTTLPQRLSSSEQHLGLLLSVDWLVVTCASSLLPTHRHAQCVRVYVRCKVWCECESLITLIFALISFGRDSFVASLPMMLLVEWLLVVSAFNMKINVFFLRHTHIFYFLLFCFILFFYF